MDKVIIDVRERDEFDIEHVKDSINIPLSVFQSVAPGILNQLRGRNITFMCYSGIRANQAKDQAAGFGFSQEQNYDAYEGGLKQWKAKGHEVVTGNVKTLLPILRQTQLTIGSMLVLFGLLGAYVDERFVVVAIAIGVGLFVAGATGSCLIASTLTKMPWNKSDIPLACKSKNNNN